MSISPIMPSFSSGSFSSQKVPLDVVIAKNGVLNRTLIELLGYHPYAIGLARNNYERLERGLDIGCWILAAIGIPFILEKVFNGYVTKKMILPKFKHAFKGLKGNRPFEIPFEWLDKAGFKQRMLAFEKDPEKLRILNRIGIKNFKSLTPKLASAILAGKIGIMFSDYFFMALKGQGYSWGKNWVTEKLSKKKGFSGEFNYTDEAFREKKTEKYKQQQKKQLIQSLLIGFGGAFLTPLVIWKLLKNPNASSLNKNSNKIITGIKKTVIPAFNPYKGVFMSRWGLLPHNIFNWNIPAILAARDKHELRELLVRAFVFDFFYFIGDDIFAGLASKVFQKKYAHLLKNIKPNGKPLQFTRKLWGIPLGVSFGDIHHMITDGNLMTLSRNQKHLIQKLGRYQFWTGILSTSLFFGVATTLLNNWYTKKRVEAEKAALQQKEFSVKTPVQPIINYT